jgi:hypothetical protein
VWLKLIFLGHNVRAYYRTGTTMAWTLVGSGDIAFPSDTPVEAGLAVTSHVDGTLGTANFSNGSVRDEDGEIRAESRREPRAGLKTSGRPDSNEVRRGSGLGDSSRVAARAARRPEDPGPVRFER